MPIALVTGASRGLGAAFAIRLASDGSDLVLVARDAASLEQVASSVRELGRSVEVLAADLTDGPGIDAVHRRLEDPNRPVDLLVNNAGMHGRGAFVTANIAELGAEIDTNITAVMRLTRAALPGMIERGRGGVINVASFAGYLSGPGSSYAASKAWVLFFTDTMAASLVGSGVHMIALCLGQMSNAMHPATKETTRPGMDPAAVVEVCLADLAKGRRLSVPGWRYRLVVFVLELPRRALRTLARVAGRGREQSRSAPASVA